MFLIDTNVISELRKRDRANASVLSWAKDEDPQRFFLSCITLLEIQYGALLVRRRDPLQGDMMLRWIANEIIPGFANRILAISQEIALACAALHVPDPRPDRDALIGATALVHGLTVVTRNTRDFEPMGVDILNPWPAPK
jgi:predicted nucleic acid-binding protein